MRRRRSTGVVAGATDGALLAHDLANALTGIRGFAELLERDVAMGDRAREYVTQLSLAVNRVESLARALTGAGGSPQPSRRAVVDLNQLVADARPMLAVALPEQVELRVDLSDATLTVRSDSGVLQRALLNLALNACDAMAHGGEITLRTRAAASRAILEVTDTGAGMTPGVSARAFEPFFTTKPSGRGSGLGLASVRQSIQELGGRVRLSSERGVGTSVELDLPLVAPSSSGELRHAA